MILLVYWQTDKQDCHAQALFDGSSRTGCCGTKAGFSPSGAARLFSVSLSSTIRWNKRLHDTAAPQRNRAGGDTRSKLNDHAAWLLDLIGKQPDLTLTEIRLGLHNDRFVVVGLATI